MNIWKPSGITSHTAVNRVRRILNIKRVGHTGTLDPMAEGVLPICIGKATRTADLIAGAKKGYRAAIKLGITTDTEDITGTVLTSCTPDVTPEQINVVSEEFVGEILQVPPMYSAVHHNGKRLYELARQGVTVERKSRQITIHSLTVSDIMDDSFCIDVICSKGTYIRTLCADIGQKLGCGATMTALTRTRSGIFTADTAVTLEDFEKDPEKYIIPIDRLFESYRRVELNADDVKRVKTGLSPRTRIAEGTICRLYSEDGEFLCISESRKTERMNEFKMITGFYEVG